MDKINFNNLPSQTTAVSAENLNQLQNNVEKSVVAINSTQPSTTEKVWFRVGKNLLNNANAFKGCRLDPDGVPYADADYTLSDYIPVAPNTQYVLSWTPETKQCVCYYAEDLSFISPRNTNTNPFTTPANCAYIRVSYLTSSAGTAQVEQGATATAYETYKLKNIFTKNSNDVSQGFYCENIVDRAVSIGNIRVNDTFVSNAEVASYVKKGYLVHVSFTLTIQGTWGNTTQFADGCPKPLGGEVRFIAMDRNTEKPVRCVINSFGQITNWYSGTAPAAGHLIEGGVTYISAE